MSRRAENQRSASRPTAQKDGTPGAKAGARWPEHRPRPPVRVEPRPLPTRDPTGRRARRRRRDSGVWSSDLVVPLALGLAALAAHFFGLLPQGAA